jgi:hypothetical protein
MSRVKITPPVRALTRAATLPARFRSGEGCLRRRGCLVFRCTSLSSASQSRRRLRAMRRWHGADQDLQALAKRRELIDCASLGELKKELALRRASRVAEHAQCARRLGRAWWRTMNLRSCRQEKPAVTVAAGDIRFIGLRGRRRSVAHRSVRMLRRGTTRKPVPRLIPHPSEASGEGGRARQRADGWGPPLRLLKRRPFADTFSKPAADADICDRRHAPPTALSRGSPSPFATAQGRDDKRQRGRLPSQPQAAGKAAAERQPAENLVQQILDGDGP